MAGIADVVIHLAREIHKQAKAGAAVPHQQEIVRTIEGELVLAVAGFIGVVGDVVPACSLRVRCQPVPSGVRKGTGPLSAGRDSTTLWVGKGCPKEKRWITE